MAFANYNFSFVCFIWLVLQSLLGVTALGQLQLGQEELDEVLRAWNRGISRKDREGSRPVRLDELGDPLPPQARFQFGTERFVSRGPILDMALSPDGRVLLTRDSDDITCWDAASGTIRWTAKVEWQQGVSYGARAFAFTGNSEHFYSQSEPEKLLKWNVATGKSTAITVKHNLPLLPENRPVNSFPGAILAIDVTRDGSRIAAAGGHGVVVYDAAGNSLFEVPNKPALAVDPSDWNRDPLLLGGHYSLALFSPDAQTLAVVTSDRPQRVCVLNGSTGAIQREIQLESRLVRMAFSPDGKSIGTTERNRAVSQFSVATGEREWQCLPPSFMAAIIDREVASTAIAYSPDGKLVSVSGEEQIHILDAANGTIISALSTTPWALAFSADSKTLYSAGLDRFIRRWDVLKSTEFPLEKGFHGSGIVATSANVNRIASSDTFGSIHVATTNAKSFAAEEKIIKTQNAQVTALALSRDGELVAAANNDTDDLIVTLWNTVSGEAVHRWQWKKRSKESKIGTLEFSADGGRLAACANGDDRAYLLDVKAGKQIAELDHPSICGLSFERTGSQLVTAGANEKLCFWNAATGELLVSKEMIGGDLQNVRCSPVDDLIVTAHFPNVLRIWNSKDMTLRKRAPLSGEANFDALAFSANGSWLATGSSGVVNVLHARTAERVWQAGSHHGRVLTLGFSEQDKVLVSGGNDGMVYGWELTPQDATDTPNYERFWEILGNGTDLEIKDLKWELVQIGDPAVDEVERRLQPITRVVNLRAIAKGVDRETAESRVRLAMQLCEKSPAVELDSRVKHAVEFLALLRSPKAMALLKQLTEKHASKDVRKEAMFALETVQ